MRTDRHGGRVEEVKGQEAAPLVDQEVRVAAQHGQKGRAGRRHAPGQDAVRLAHGLEHGQIQLPLDQRLELRGQERGRRRVRRAVLKAGAHALCSRRAVVARPPPRAAKGVVAQQRLLGRHQPVAPLACVCRSGQWEAWERGGGGWIDRLAGWLAGYRGVPCPT